MRASRSDTPGPRRLLRAAGLLIMAGLVSSLAAAGRGMLDRADGTEGKGRDFSFFYFVRRVNAGDSTPLDGFRCG